MVKEVLVNEGQIDFWTVRMRPGKPLAFGRLTAPDGRTVPHIGLPGNPVSSMLAFELFGRPLIHKMLGRLPQPRPTLRAITDDVIENPDGRRVYARAILRRTVDGRWHVQLTGPQGSGILTSLAAANALAICPEDPGSDYRGGGMRRDRAGRDRRLGHAPNRLQKHRISLEGSIGLREKFKLFAAINPKRGFAIKVSEFVPGQVMT